MAFASDPGSKFCIVIFMLAREISLPVRVPDLGFGFAYGLGILRAGPYGLALELEIREAFFDSCRLGGNEFRIDFDALISVRLQAGWFRTVLVIQTNTLKALQGCPGAKGCELRLRLARKDRSTAVELVSAITLEIQGRSVRQMIQSLEQPPGPSAAT